ncbi:hypothetical protein [Methylibium sp.]|uniref:hypothetical protein n=1 Tax=Methylibium sp. TaxID=2067992 RepID=UPI003D14E7CF
MNAATAQRIDVVDADPIEEQPQPTQAVALQQPQQIAAPAGRQLSVVEYAMQNGASAADVRALVELQIQMDNHKLAMLKQQDERDREERNRLAVLAFRRDFAAFRGENIVIPKSKEVDRGKAGSFMQAEYDQVCSRLSVALSRHGFSFRHDQKFGLKKIEGADGAEPWVWVTCFLEHREGHRETLDLEGPPGDLSANTPVQNMQATTSYLKRQSLLAITGTATGGEDDEGAMRRKTGREAETSVDEALIDKGRSASMEGMAALTAWWGALTARQRSELNKEFPAMRRAAQEADRGA